MARVEVSHQRRRTDRYAGGVERNEEGGEGEAAGVASHSGGIGDGEAGGTGGETLVVVVVK